MTKIKLTTEHIDSLGLSKPSHERAEFYIMQRKAAYEKLSPNIRRMIDEAEVSISPVRIYDALTLKAYPWNSLITEDDVRRYEEKIVSGEIASITKSTKKLISLANAKLTREK